MSVAIELDHHNGLDLCPKGDAVAKARLDSQKHAQYIKEQMDCLRNDKQYIHDSLNLFLLRLGHGKKLPSLLASAAGVDSWAADIKANAKQELKHPNKTISSRAKATLDQLRARKLLLGMLTPPEVCSSLARIPNIGEVASKVEATFALRAELLPQGTAKLLCKLTRREARSRDPLLAALAASAERADEGSPDMSDVDSDDSWVVPMRASHGAMCAVIEFLVNSERQWLGSTDQGARLREVAAPVEEGWRASASTSEPASSASDPSAGKHQPPQLDFSPTLQSALGRTHSWLFGPELRRALAREAIRTLPMVYKPAAHRSADSLLYWSPVSELFANYFSAYLSKSKTGQLDLEQPSADALVFVLATVRYVLHMNDPDVFGLTDEPLVVGDDAPVLTFHALDEKDRPTREVGIAVAGMAGSSVALEARHAKYDKVPASIKLPARRRSGVASKDAYRRPSTEAIETVTRLILTVGSTPYLLDAVAAMGPASRISDLPCWPSTLFMGITEGLTSSRLAAELERFNATPMGALPPLHRALAPGLFDFFRIHMRGIPAPTSATIHTLASVWSVTSLATLPYLVRAIVGAAIALCLSALPRLALRLLCIAANLVDALSFARAPELAACLKSLLATGQFAKSFMPLAGKFSLSVPDTADADDSPECAGHRRNVCDGRGTQWAAERAAAFSDFPTVEIRGPGGKGVSVPKFPSTFVWADAVTTAQDPADEPEPYICTRTRYADWEPYVVQHFHTIVHPLHCLLRRLERLPMLDSPHDGRLDALLDVVDFLDDQVAETLWLCSDLAVKRALATPTGKATLHAQKVDPAEHSRAGRAGRRYACIPLAEGDEPVVGAEVPFEERSRLQRLLRMGEAAVCLASDTESGRIVHSLYHLRPAATRLCQRLVEHIRAAKVHTAIYGDVQRDLATFRRQVLAANESDLLEEEDGSWWNRLLFNASTHCAALSESFAQLGDAQWFGLGSGSRYCGPNVGRLQFCLLRLITVFELDEADIFKAPKAKRGPGGRSLRDTMLGSVQFKWGSAEVLSFDREDAATRSQQLQHMHESALGGTLRAGSAPPPLQGHPSHAPLRPTELGPVKDLTQRICIAGMWLVSPIVGTPDLDIFDSRSTRRRTARRILDVGRAAGSYCREVSDSVVARRVLVTQRMVPNWLRPLSDVRVLGSLLAASLILTEYWGCTGAAMVWGVFAVALLWMLLPQLQPQYRIENFARLPTDLAAEVWEMWTSKASGGRGLDESRQSRADEDEDDPEEEEFVDDPLDFAPLGHSHAGLGDSQATVLGGPLRASHFD
ncbi:hypothetical protein FNF28_04753 [Cafeteria roenbergensis]|uniref:Uncharacterized protein n=1 Tax=Cafeteria roenbergensis TaxID=33653 RepID=A0A5A8DCH8_CAFRO|nr:hypothetical protein FNF28_04753 [Cafeteria roenbergensis]